MVFMCWHRNVVATAIVDLLRLVAPALKRGLIASGTCWSVGYPAYPCWRAAVMSPPPEHGRPPGGSSREVAACVDLAAEAGRGIAEIEDFLRERARHLPPDHNRRPEN